MSRTFESAKSVRAAILERFNEPYVVKEVPKPPEPEDHDLLVRVLAASYCHTDAVFCAGAMSQILPRIGSHEFAGEVVAIGSSVSLSLDISVGTKVGIPGRAYHPCSECYECINNDGDPEGYSPYCPNAQNLGLTRNGGFQDYCLVDSRQVVAIPEGLSAVETAPLMCAGLTIWAALQKPEVIQSNHIAIIGAGGGLGHLGVQFAAKLGLGVVAVDMGESAMRVIAEVISGLGDGAKRVITVDVKEKSAEEVLKSMSQNTSSGSYEQNGVDAVILLSESQPALDYGMKLVRNHGTIVVVSFPESGFKISARDLVFRDIKVIGSLVGRNRQLKEMITFAAKHRVVTKIKSFPLERINDLVGAYQKGDGGKFVVDMNL